jgi:hypothetical protein
MTGQGGMGWFKQRRGFVAGVAVGLVTALSVIGYLLTGSSSGRGNVAGGATARVTAGTGSGVVTPVPLDSTSVGPGASASVGPGASAGVSAVAVPPVSAVGPVSLGGWKLTLPVDGGGNLSGTAAQLSAAAVTGPWLNRAADGSLNFWAPSDGAKTANSAHARTELVSTNDFALGAGVHTLSALLAVTQVPAGARDICVGQIHGGGPIKSVPFVMLHWRDGNIVVIVKQVVHGSRSQSITLLTGVPLGARFGYTMSDNGNGTLTFTAVYDGQARQATAVVVPAFVGTDQRFQAGDYQQATSGSSPSDGGKATFYALTES